MQQSLLANRQFTGMRQSRHLADTFASFGLIALALRLPGRAIGLFAAAAAVQEASGAPVLWWYAEIVAQALADARGQLDPARAERAWSEGRAMSIDEALEYALETIETGPDGSHDSVAPPDVAPHGLSPRELDVLRLLVEGRSNQEIAAALFISPRTAANHVANIMNKLGLDSRTAVAAWAIRHAVV
jgi:DNA-binding CsgD family transcriptional regulator